MSKIGILTFHNTMNYGASLQAYALRRVIADLGYTVEVVDYRCPKVTQQEIPRKPSVGFMLKHPRGGYRESRAFPRKMARRVEFDRFSEEVIGLGPRCYCQEDIQEIYDMVVVGSDQVWNLACTGDDLTFFLTDFDGYSAGAISYAASFGSSVMDGPLESACGAALSRFRSVSVREKEAVKIVKDISGRQAEWVLDPTLMLQKEDWLGLIAPRQIDDRYVFCYVVSERKKTIARARELAASLGAKVALIDCYGAQGKARDIVDCTSASPEQFLSLILYSEAVVTSSFHGMALSIELEKQFYYCLPDSSGSNGRLISLAALLDLQDRDASCGFNSETTIDYDAVRRTLQNAREESRSFLERSLEV